MSSFKFEGVSSSNQQASQPVIREFDKFDYDNMPTQKDFKYPDLPMPIRFSLEQAAGNHYTYNNHFDSPIDHACIHQDQSLARYHNQDNDDQSVHYNEIEYHPNDIVIEEVPSEEIKHDVSMANEKNANKNKSRQPRKKKEPLRVVDENIIEAKFTPVDHGPNTERNLSRRKTPKSQLSRTKNPSSSKQRLWGKLSKNGIEEKKVLQNFEKCIGWLNRSASGSINARANFQRSAKSKDSSSAHQTADSFSGRV